MLLAREPYYGAPPAGVPTACLGPLTLDDQTHAASGAFHHPPRRVQVARVQVRHLFLANIFDLFLTDGAHLVFVWHPGAFGDAGRLFQQRGCGGTLGDEVKRTIVIDRDDDGDGRSVVFLGAIVELLEPN